MRVKSKLIPVLQLQQTSMWQTMTGRMLHTKRSRAGVVTRKRGLGGESGQGGEREVALGTSSPILRITGHRGRMKVDRHTEMCKGKGKGREPLWAAASGNRVRSRTWEVQPKQQQGGWRGLCGGGTPSFQGRWSRGELRMRKNQEWRREKA